MKLTKKSSDSLPKRYRARLVYLLIISIVYILLTFLKRRSHSARFISNNISYPVRNALAVICSVFRYSVAEWMLILLVLFTIYIIVSLIISLIRRKDGVKTTLFRYFSLILTATISIVFAVELLLNVPYYSDTFIDLSGITPTDSSVEALYMTTAYFAKRLSSLSDKVKRDDDLIFAEDVNEIFEDSLTIYRGIEERFPFLKGEELRCKRVRFSKALSIVETTGVAFPLTGEANINIDQPSVSIPSTIAHEIAHQRRITSEQEANFVAILASDLSGNDVYMYSAYLMAYNYLANTLRSEDYDLFLEIHTTLPEAVRRDMQFEYDYWKQYDTKVSEYSDNLYDSFLKSQGQAMGTKSYGAVVDLLIAYYA
ncbi:MAG: DUF3810 domain-containing protein [Oscillospiraceae bacterium]|nr:DUF3810 domain-containing protein [Oscillospiraceae bacterium]